MERVGVILFLEALMRYVARSEPNGDEIGVAAGVSE